MKYMFKYGLIVSIALLAASLAMFVASAWTGNDLAPAINTIQFVLVVYAVIQAYILFARLGKGTIMRRLWAVVSASMSVVRSRSGAATGVAPAASALMRYIRNPCSVNRTSVSGPA